MPNPVEPASDAAQPLNLAIVVHRIPGRLRLRIDRLSWDPDYRDRLEQQVKQLTGVTEVRLNAAAGALVITYIDTDSATAETELLQAIQQLGGLQWQALEATPAAETQAFLDLNPKMVEGKLKEIGGAVIGGAAGDMVGGAIGGAAGAVVMGPPGAILGSQMGVFVGGVIGARLGAETVTQIDQLTQEDLNQEAPMSAGKVAAALHKRAGGKIGETTGELMGGMVGRAVLGPTGEMVGTIVGGTIVGQLGEEVSTQLTPLKQESDAQTKAPQTVFEQAQDWLDNTTKHFVGETASATIGGALGTMMLGPQGQTIGRKLGSRISRFVDWNPQSPTEANSAATTAVTQPSQPTSELSSETILEPIPATGEPSSTTDQQA